MGPNVCDCMEQETADPKRWDSRNAKVIIFEDGYAGVNVFTVADDTNKTSSTEFQDEWKRMKDSREHILKDTL